MNFLRNERKKTKTLFAVFVVSIVIIIFYYGGNSLVKWSGDGVRTMSAGLFGLQFSFSENWGKFKSNLKSKESLYRENEQLKESIGKLSLFLQNQNLITEENSRLKEILGRNENKAIVLGKVLAKPNRSLYDTLIIDIGLDSGLKEGDLAIASRSVIGKVVRVSTNSSKIRLFSSPGEEINVNVGQANIPTVAYGLGGGNFEIKLPKDTEIKEGDIISSFENGVEILGLVGAIEKKESDSFQKIFAKSLVNISELGWIEIIKNK